jgi:hypothetical protein
VRKSSYIDFKTWNSKANLRARISPSNNSWDISDFRDKYLGTFPTFEYMIHNYEPWYAAWTGHNFKIENGAHGDPKDVDSIQYVGWEVHPPEFWECRWDAKNKIFIHTHIK